MVIIVVLLLISTFLIAFHLAKMSDPYIKEVLSRQGNVSRGYEIFQINCAACHGQFADGIVGPSLEDVCHRKSRISLIEQVISGKTPPMPKFQPDTQAMADLLVYLENLSKK
ncbi:MAG: cytochrome c [Microcystis aeruginosa BS13-02]|uniref:Cytochrome c n=2 Tax=Microcystaceae TaxID=1890449 RepID=A0A552EU67_MICAE|nr:cytochrome c [Microcystis aeruginosa BS13-02]TRU28411.1 MAG: cytochrome c [Microcystis aeruginosa Ma_MB_S_20031200_S102D]TRU38010.1 MAG: cytochrome c [Microcystis aeruginosa Ma_MB_S_20031200_S102]